MAEDWTEQLGGQKTSIYVSIEYDAKRTTVTDTPTDIPFSFPRCDENLLYVLEDICGGVIKNEIQISIYDLINILRLHHGKAIHQKGQKKECLVHTGMLDSVMEMDMDRENGEFILHVTTELPDGKVDMFPTYIIGQNTGWIFSAGAFWPLSSILPKPMREIYDAKVIIPRENVPAFLMTELALIEKVVSVRTAITPDLFFMKPAKPTFRLVVKGSPASLAATLYVRYNDDVELVAGRADMRGNFAIPDSARLA